MKFLKTKLFANTLILSLGVAFTPNANAGVGWYITLINNTDHSVSVNGIFGWGKEFCWYPNDLLKTISIDPHSRSQIYTEEQNSGTSCHVYADHTVAKYANLEINGVPFYLEALYDENEVASAHRKISNIQSGAVAMHNGKDYSMNAFFDTTRALVIINGDQDTEVFPAGIDWE